MISFRPKVRPPTLTTTKRGPFPVRPVPRVPLSMLAPSGRPGAEAERMNLGELNLGELSVATLYGVWLVVIVKDRTSGNIAESRFTEHLG